MAGSGHTASDERGAEKLMDDYLKSIGYHRKKIAKDGSCLFRAVAEQVLHCQSLHTEVRTKCVEFLKQNRESYEAFIEGDFEQYVCDLQDPQQWVGEVEINALAAIYKRDFLIYQDPGKPPVNITGNNFKDKVLLCFLNGNHYDSVYPISRIKNTAVCQSILYEILYNNVFKVERNSLGLCQRIGRPTDVLSDDCMAACASSDGSDLDTDEPLWVENGTSTSSTRHQSYRGRGRGQPLPERVRRSLNPTLLRNVALDIWHESKRAQQKMDYCIAAGMQYTVGDRCQVRLEGSARNYNATVKEAPPVDNLLRVHIEELGDRRVPVWSLRPPADEKSWSTVVNKEKRLSNGDLEERGRGRGRGKPAPAPSSQAAAPGSGGRVQKQHSWPQQATVDEQGGAKPTRKSGSLSVSESVSFGLTEEERLAKEEEQRNVALVEIQLRDEHSFPALGTGSQGDGGRKKGTEKRRSQRNKTKSPEEDVRAASPPAGEKPTATPTSPSSTTTVTTSATPPNPHLPAASPSSPCSSTNATAAPSGSAPALTPTSAAPATKTNAPSQSSAAAPSAKPSVTGGALSQSVPCSATVFSFLTPVLPTASPAVSSSSSSSLPPKSNASPPPPPPPSSVPPPTFIAPIAPSPAHGFLPPSSHQRSSLPHSPSPPPSSSSSSSLNSQAAQVREPQAQTPNSGGSVATSETSLTQGEVQTRPCLPKSESEAPLTQSQMQEDQSVIPLQNQPQPLTEVPQAQISLPHHSSSQADTVHHQSSSPSYPQASLPVSSSPQLHPGQPPHPSLCISASPTRPSLPTQSRTETPQPPPQPEAPAHPPSQPTHHPHPAHHPPLPSAPHPPSIPGAVPLQNLSQLYQDPLYPGFPLGEKGDIGLTPPYSSSKSGNDLPQDVNVLRFFFNMGVKAYSMPMFPPYIYLLPLQQAYALQPKLPSRSPSPHFPPANAPIRHQEAYPPNPPTSVPALPVYSHQAALAEPPRPSEPSLNPAGYPVSQPPPQRMPCTSLPWQQHQMPPPTNSTYPVGYPSSAPPYQLPPSSQGYHPGQGAGHSLYPSPMPPYPPSSLGYQSPSNSDKLQVPQGAMEQLQPANGDTLSGPGPLHAPAVANANSRTMMVSCVNNFALKKEQGESMTRTVLLVDPPLNNTPILALVSNSDDSVSMTTMKPSSTPASPLPYGIISKTVPNDTTLGYQVHPKHFNPHKVYSKLGAPEPAKAGHVQAMPVTDSLSVGCSTEDDWEERDGFRTGTLNPRGSKKTYRGGRGRGGGYDGGRGGHRRRQGGEGFNHGQFSSSYRGRGW